jgi:hypothetical protein
MTRSGSKASALGVSALDLLERHVIRRSTTPDSTAVDAARRLNAAAGLLATSVLADSAIEHWRGAFENRAMYIPLVTGALSLLVSGHGVADRRPAAHAVRDAAYAASGITGLIGTGLHIYNVTKRPGGISWINLFYGAPLGAPMALLLSGLFGFAAERVRNPPPHATPRILGLPAGRATAALAALGMLGTVGEAGLLHFRGAFQNPFMWLPVSLPPVGAALLASAARDGGAAKRRFTRVWLGLTAALGLGGVGFHIFGVSRAMGGWKNWRQNLIDGPPIPAPPAFTALSLAGLSALALHRREMEAAA